ncbi:winged helix-turn-helix domain-containing protein [Aeromonas rivipollensis]|uniref:winged helix-turn-helix domain-containing protein n=1 Tax=Aeromonas TaxID=642 RepID=UPI003D190E6D
MYLKNKEKGIVIDLINGVVLSSDSSGMLCSQTIKMGSKEVSLLKYLAKNSGYVISKTELLHHVWRDQNVHENTVLVTLSGIRKIFRKAELDCRCIVTIAKFGYIFYPRRAGLEMEGFNDSGKHSMLWFN